MKESKGRLKLPGVDRFSGYLVSLGVWVVLVLALVMVAILVNPSLPTAQLQGTGTPLPTQPAQGVPALTATAQTAAHQSIPVVNTTGIVILAGLIVLIMFAALTREVLWYRKQQPPKG